MSERNALPDRFERELDARLQNWRTAAPSPRLKSRIAAEIQGTARTGGAFSLSWRYALTVAACAVGVCVALLCLSLQPQPSFARVEEAMKSVRYLSYRTSREATMADGSVEHTTTETWIRRQSPAVATRSVVRRDGNASHPAGELYQRTFKDENREITLDEKSGTWKARGVSSQEDVAKEVESRLFAFTQPGHDPSWVVARLQVDTNLDASPWQVGNAPWRGRPAWTFLRTIRQKESEHTWGEKDTLSTVRLWADPMTRRVLHCEVVITDGKGNPTLRIESTDFRYDAPPPPGTFDLKPPKKASPKKVRR